MFIRKLKNRSGSLSVQVIQKINGRNKLLKSVGCATTQHELENLILLARQEIKILQSQPQLLISEGDLAVEEAFSRLSNAHIQTLGPELISGRIFDSIGFGAIKEKLFRHLVIARLAFPLSKLKTIDYLYRYQGLVLDIDAVYRFLDKLKTH